MIEPKDKSVRVTAVRYSSEASMFQGVSATATVACKSSRATMQPDGDSPSLNHTLRHCRHDFEIVIVSMSMP